MARKDRLNAESEITDETVEDVALEAPDLAGLVKMHKDGQVIHAHPHVIKEHEKNGWKRA